MQTFARNKIALAVGAGLLAMAGTASAVVAPAARTLQPALISAITAGVAEDLLTTAGANKAITIDLALTSGPALTLAGAGTTSGSPVVPVTSTAGMGPGMTVTATGLTALTVLSIDSAVQFTATANASATVAGNLLTASAPVGPVNGAAGANPTIAGTVAASAALLANQPTQTDDNVTVYVGTVATPVAGAVTAALGTTASGAAHLTINLPAPGAGKAYRLTTAGALEYSSDSGATWAAVKVDLKKATTGAGAASIWSEVSGTGGFDGTDVTLAPLTGIAVGNSIAPTPVIATTGTPTAAAPLINGISVDTVVPISAFTIVTSVAVTPNNNSGQLAAIHAVTPFSSGALTSGAAWTATSATGTLGAAVAATATKPPTFKNTLAFLPAADWTSGAAADDLIYAASPVALNTGIQGAALPVTLTVGSTPPTYSTVFSTTDGTPALVSFAAGAVAPGKVGDGTSATDGVAPILVSAATNTTAKTLSLKFSEPMTIFAGSGNALGEIAENVLAGTDSLAALNLNANGTLSIPGAGAIAPTAGQSTLVMSDTTTGLVTSTAGKTITVNTGVYFGENNDGTGATVKTTIDGDGGLSSTSGVVEAASGAQTASASVLNVAFDTTNSVATTARASTGADATKVATIQVKFPADGAVAFAAGKTVTDLAGQIVVHVTGYASAGAPVQWDFFPSAAQMALADSRTLNITIPTELLYTKLASNIAMNLKYLNNPGGGVAGPNVLVSASSATDVVDASTAGLTVTIPFAATAATSNLLTQSIIGTLTSAASVNGDKVEAYVAKWEDAPATSGIARNTITTGVINGAPVSFSTTSSSATWGIGSNGVALAAKLDAEEAKLKAAEVPGLSAATNAGVPPTVYVASMYGTAYVSSLSAADAIAAATTGASSATTAVKNAATSAGFTGAVATGASGSGIDVYGGNNRTTQGATATSAQAAIQAGVAAALAAVVDTNNIPAVVVDAARKAAMAPNATVASVVNAVLGAKQSPVAVPVTVGFDGSIKGAGVAGKFDVTKTSGSTGTRGLVFIKNDGTDQTTAAAAGTWASGVVGTVNGVPNSYNLLLGIEPTAADIALKKNKNWFVLLLHTPGTAANAAALNLLTSAHPLATNFVQFSPNLITGLGSRTTLSTDLAKIKKLAPATSTNWALYGLGSPGSNAVAPAGHNPHFVRWFVGIQNASSQPASFWTSDGAGSDVALTMKANQVSVATEVGANKGTLSTIQASSFVAGAAAFAWKNDAAGVTNDHVDVLQAGTPAAGSVKVNKGWSLVTVPATMAAAVPASVDALIKVGAQVSSGYTWVKSADAATTPLPSLTAGEAVFVYSNCALLAGCPIN
jgi:hypothetical protein